MSSAKLLIFVFFLVSTVLKAEQSFIVVSPYFTDYLSTPYSVRQSAKSLFDSSIIEFIPHPGVKGFRTATPKHSADHYEEIRAFIGKRKNKLIILISENGMVERHWVLSYKFELMDIDVAYAKEIMQKISRLKFYPAELKGVYREKYKTTKVKYLRLL